MAYVPNATDETNPLDSVDRSTAAAEFRTLKAYIKTTILGLIASLGAVTGEIKVYSGSVAPTGYLLVPKVATNISRVTYSALHAVIAAAGYPWGNGDGSTTFGMPFIPADYTPVQANANLGTNSVGAVLTHTHTGTTLNIPTQSPVQGGASPYYYPNVITNAASAQPATSPLTIANTGGAANLAAGVRLNYIIKT